jgi:hypothetical protein
MKKIALTKGMETLVDDADFEWLSAIPWRADPVSGRFYAATQPAPIRMHRLIMNAGPGQVVDHINGNPLDNRRENLRLCSHAQNMFNSKKPSTNTTGYVGVIRKRKKFAAMISINDKSTYLGTFDTAKEAAVYRDKIARQIRGEFACLNFQDQA